MRFLVSKFGLLLIFTFSYFVVGCTTLDEGVEVSDSLLRPKIEQIVEFELFTSELHPIAFEIPKTWVVFEGPKSMTVTQGKDFLNASMVDMPRFSISLQDAYLSSAQERWNRPQPASVFAQDALRVSRLVDPPTTLASRFDMDWQLARPISIVNLNNREVAFMYRTTQDFMTYDVYVPYAADRMFMVFSRGRLAVNDEVVTITNQIISTFSYTEAQ